MFSMDYNYQYIDWAHDPIPGENFDHLGNLITHVVSPTLTIGLSNYLNLTVKQAIGVRSMDWMGIENSDHHRDENTLSDFKNAHGSKLGDTDLLLKYLITNAGSESGSRIFLGLGLSLPATSVLTKSPYLSDIGTGEALEEHRHFSLSDGCYKINYELQYYIKSDYNHFLLPSFYGLTLNYLNPLDDSEYGYNPGSSFFNVVSLLYNLNTKSVYLPKALNIGLIYTKTETTKWNGEKSPISGADLFTPNLGFNWVGESFGSVNLSIRYMNFAPLQSDKLNNKSSAWGIALGYRKVLDYTIPWLYW